jgi:hypothetical protein
MKVGYYDMARDYGTQGIESSHVHAMSQKNQSVQQAQLATAAEIHEKMSLGTLKGTGYALHTNDDSFAGGHAGYQPYGGLKEIPFSHYVNDFFPSSETVKQAQASAIQLINSYKSSPFSEVGVSPGVSIYPSKPNSRGVQMVYKK